MSDPELTPEQDEAVRALLASVRHTDPTPPEVVARLDETLASLTAERREVPAAPVVTLASRRRRRVATALLAAAAVVVGGVGITQVLPGLAGSDGDSSSAGSTAEAPMSADDSEDSAGGDRGLTDQSQRSSSADEKQDDSERQGQESAPLPSASALGAGAALTTDEPLRPQVRAIQPQAPFTSSYDAGSACLVVAQTGESVAVTYGDQPGVLVFRVPDGGTQRVDLFLCGRPDAVRSLRLRAP
ncbi:hypothetical protein [Nocardioides currus]|uniref:hypothetical protein n=1 Tax=Nocardioides currus TaxID=2133958 RepID=UPI00105718D9|nr:hypothetical protein [Nocardioides currus]